MTSGFMNRGRVRRATRDNRAYAFSSPEALQAAWRKFKQTGDDRIRNQLIEHYLYLARCIAERIGAKLPDEVEIDDLMSAGIFGLMDAIDAFDLERGVKFETYCAPRVRGAIFDELRTMDWVPRLVRHRAHQLEAATRALEVEFGRNPSDEELAARMGLSRSHFDKLRRDASAVSLVSLSRKYSDEESSRDTFEIDVLPDDRGCDPVHETQRKDLKELITRGLNRDEKLIIVLYYYEQMTMKEIGMTLDLSESRVSQMHSAILDRLRDKLQMRIPEFEAVEE